MATSLTKYLGLHGPESTNYVTGGMDAWMQAFDADAEDSRGAPLAFKRRDGGGFWTAGQAAPVPADKLLMMSEASPYGFQIYGSWIPFEGSDPLIQSGWTSAKHTNLMAAATQVALTWPRECRLIFGNKRNGSNYTGTEAFWATLVGEIGGIWTKHGREWGTVDDEGPAAVLDKLPLLRQAWEAFGGSPTFIMDHAYGLDDWMPKHRAMFAKGVRAITGRDNIEILHHEAHWWFVGQGDPRASQPDVYEAPAGGYCADICEANAAAGIQTCLFTLMDFFELANFNHTNSMKELISRANGQRNVPSIMGNWRQSLVKSYGILNKYQGKGAALLNVLARG